MVAELYPRRTAAHTLDFLELVLDSFAVPVQCVQTERGSEFIALKVQIFLRQHSVKYRPLRPGSLYLNGKVERAQRTAKAEFWSSIDLDQPDLADEFGTWVMYYNYQRVHSSLGVTPIDRFCERIYDTPEWADVVETYALGKERLHERDYHQDRLIQQLKAGKPKTDN
jgi:transposase InsO family protein